MKDEEQEPPFAAAAVGLLDQVRAEFLRLEDEWAQDVAGLESERDRLRAELAEAGVSPDPEGPHKAEGCRIGGRLDELIGAREDLRLSLAMAAQRKWCNDALAALELRRGYSALFDAA